MLFLGAYMPVTALPYVQPGGMPFPLRSAPSIVSHGGGDYW